MTGKKNDSIFTEIKDLNLIHRIFNVICKHRVILTCWFKDQNLRFDTVATEFFPNIRRMLLEYPQIVPETELLNAVKVQNSELILISFQLDKVNFFLKANLKGRNDANTLKIETPYTLFKLQRRNAVRISFKKEQSPDISFVLPEKSALEASKWKPEDFLKFKLLDISVGGLSFEAEEKYKDQPLKKGVKLYNMNFFLKDQPLKVSGLVMHLSKIKNDSTPKVFYRVGVQFTTLDPISEKAIAQFTLEESRKMFSLLY